MSIFQSKQFLRVIESSANLQPFHIQRNGNNGSVYIQGFITNENSQLRNYFMRRCIIYGNPSSGTSEELFLILSEIKSELANKVIFIEIRNSSDQTDNISTYEKHGFMFENHLNILVDLTKSEEELWKDVSSKRRNEIRRATKEGTTFEVKNDLESLRECYTILKEVYSRAKLPLFKLDFFENLYKYLQGDAKLHIFAAIYDGRIIGCMLALGYNGILYDYYAGAHSEYYKKYPNDLIPWEVFLWGKKNGYHTFDFGGAGKPGVPYKVRDYKKQFGGTIVDHGRFKLILNKPLYKIGELGVKLLKKYG